MNHFVRQWQAAVWIAALVLVHAMRADADCSFRLVSHAFGSGTFGYELTVQRNTFLDNIYDVELYAPGFAGYVNASASDGGSIDPSETNAVNPTWSGDWPAAATHLVTAWSGAEHVGRTNAFILFLANVAGWSSSPYLSGNIAGYVKLPVLVASTNNDPTITDPSLTTNVVIVPDPQIVDVTPRTISFAWATNATMRIEAAWRTGEWVAVTNALHYPPVTTWTSAVPLADLGDLFRVVLLAASHNTNLLRAARTAALDVPVERVRPSAAGAEVTLKTAPGSTYEVSLSEPGGRVLDSVLFSSPSGRVVVLLRDGNTRGPVLVRARRLGG